MIRDESRGARFPGQFFLLLIPGLVMLDLFFFSFLFFPLSLSFFFFQYRNDDDLSLSPSQCEIQFRPSISSPSEYRDAIYGRRYACIQISLERWLSIFHRARNKCRMSREKSRKKKRNLRGALTIFRKKLKNFKLKCNRSILTILKIIVLMYRFFTSVLFLFFFWIVDILVYCDLEEDFFFCEKHVTSYIRKGLR